ncbi:MAG: YkgJ family cysteine cluster protein [Archangium sp.]|nr:YkgJ family cysteine cluster protein [Archangium sp.]
MGPGSYEAKVPDAATDLAWRKAATETRAILKKGSEAWSQHGCPGTAECCQLAITKRAPWLWPSEWKVIEDRLKRDKRPLPPAREDGACPFLDAAGKRCTIYEDRPLGCRTYFCHRITGPSRQPAEQTNALLERLASANVAVDDQAAPKSLEAWVSSARRPATCPAEP